MCFATPASSDLPVSVHATRLTVDLAGLLALQPNIAWIGPAERLSNERVVLDIR